ncbi:hypothetical protein VNO77_42100 [Canavalia gladiata]|uniref:Uncharacterized protein n=1 Tax=Canavalia gladiata TaxID=3824 RepID=A0AAN9PSJ2_CANGL
MQGCETMQGALQEPWRSGLSVKLMRPSCGEPGYVNGSTSLLEALVDALVYENRLHDQAATGVSNVFAEAFVFLAPSKV